MKTSFTAAFITCLALLVCPLKSQTAFAPKVDKFLSELSQKGLSGSVLVATKEGIFKKGYGFADRELQINASESTVYTVGSVTKQFTAAAILKLEMQGKLSVTDKLSQFFPNLPADKAAISLHQLLTHTAGFKAALGGDYEVLERDDFLKQAFAMPLLKKQGNQYEYSNIGYSILAAIIEKVSGINYEKYLYEHLFKPAGMSQTGYLIPKFEAKKLSVGYQGDKRWGKSTEKAWSKTGPYWNLLGNGGILSTVEDMYRWHQALSGNTILNEEAKKKLYTRHTEEGEGAGTFYGYGWALFPTPRNTTLVTHNGGNGVFYCDFLRYLEEGVTIIFFTNAVKKEWRRIPQEIALSIFKPNHEPTISLRVSETFPSFDQHPERVLLESFWNNIRNGDASKIEVFVKANMEERLLKNFPLERHITMLSQVGREIKDAEIESVSINGDNTIVKFKNKPIQLTIVIDNGKIGGLQLAD